MTDDIHSCSPFCDRPECIKKQRDEMREKLSSLEADLAQLRLHIGAPWTAASLRQVNNNLVLRVARLENLLKVHHVALPE